MDRVYNIMRHTGANVSFDIDLRHLMYLSNKVEQDKVEAEKRNQMSRS